MTPLGRIEPHRTFEAVAEQLRRQMALRLVGSSGTLPSERQLATIFGVGRATVQRALAELESEGLVERRRGRAGGTFVVGAEGGTAPDRRLLDAVRRHGDEIEQALAFRLEVEPAVAAHAAGGRSAADVRAIRAAAAVVAPDMPDEEFMRADTGFHLAVARATGNRFFVDATERLRVVLNDPLVALPDSPTWHAWSADEHARIVAAIETRDAAGARAAAAAHVSRTDDAVRALLRTIGA